MKNVQLHLKLKKCDFKQDNPIFHLLEWQKVQRFIKTQNWQRSQEAGTFHYTDDGKVNRCNIFGGQFENIYQKCKSIDPVLGISMIHSLKCAKIFV